jgi:hypothetical protein
MLGVSARRTRVLGVLAGSVFVWFAPMAVPGKLGAAVAVVSWCNRRVCAPSAAAANKQTQCKRPCLSVSGRGPTHSAGAPRCSPHGVSHGGANGRWVACHSMHHATSNMHRVMYNVQDAIYSTYRAPCKRTPYNTGTRNEYRVSGKHTSATRNNHHATDHRAAPNAQQPSASQPQWTNATMQRARRIAALGRVGMAPVGCGCFAPPANTASAAEPARHGVIIKRTHARATVWAGGSRPAQTP